MLKVNWKIRTISATSDETTARKFIKRALELNPQFDPRQSAFAKTLL